MGKRERRINQTQFEIRTLEDGKTIILEGYALKFGKRSEDFGGVDEILERGCLDKTDMSNVVALTIRTIRWREIPFARDPGI